MNRYLNSIVSIRKDSECILDFFVIPYLNLIAHVLMLLFDRKKKLHWLQRLNDYMNILFCKSLIPILNLGLEFQCFLSAVLNKI
jgi:hypothetical protein